MEVQYQRLGAGQRNLASGHKIFPQIPRCDLRADKHVAAVPLAMYGHAPRGRIKRSSLIIKVTLKSSVFLNRHYWSAYAHYTTCRQYVVQMQIVC
eukprot:6209604-Pleurochrysis_carterae.AAC.4